MKNKLAARAMELDLLRGVAVILMMFDHLMFDLCGLLPGFFWDYPLKLQLFAIDYWYWDVRLAVRPVILFVFFALTGICSSFSRSNLARGIKLLAVAMGLTVATDLIGFFAGDEDIRIVFGVLHAISISLILVGLLEKLRTNKWIYLGVGLALWGVGIWIDHSYNVGLVSYGDEPFWTQLGKAIMGFLEVGSDCFPLPRTAGQIFVGVFLGKQFYKERKSLIFKRYHRNPVAFIGRHSLLFYFGHQILFPVIAALVLVCMGYELFL